MSPDGAAASRLPPARVLGLLALGLVLLAAGCLGPDASEPAPPFEVETAAGQTWNLSDHAGTPVVLDFMATWCHPCNDQSREVEAAREEAPEAAYLSLGVDPDENASDLRDWKARHGAAWSHASAPQVATDYGVTTIPTIVVVDADGRIAWTSSGREVVDSQTILAKLDGGG